MRVLYLLSVGLLCLSLGSCAAVFKGSSSKIDLNSKPQGAKVYVNGKLMGETPLKLKLESKLTYTIEFRKEGYPAKTVNVKNHVNGGWILLDVLWGLVPVILDAVIIDVTTGSLYELNEKSINAILEKQQPHPGA